MTADQRRTFRAVVAADTAALVVFAVAMVALAGPDAPVWAVLAAIGDGWQHAATAVQTVWNYAVSAVITAADHTLPTL